MKIKVLNTKKSTREELQELFTTDDEDLLDIQKSENNKETECFVTASSAWTYKIYSQDFSYAASTEKMRDKVSTSEDEMQDWTDESVWFAPSEPTTKSN
ncbi:hypothetical protein CDAR_98301 [Caerostris darwini]|uniref:Uncharacterized protein n=1 Tax=Caerostris darwini TaxID=1538125 RepID=A0AAV4UFR6_9ARAC|nr:hypothetical protein CDAR_98301 [Caerostris darwini]